MNLLKKLVLGVTTFAFAVIPVATNAQNNVRIESTVDVRNTTTNTPYAASTSAKVDEVIAVQVWYHNMEEADSNKVADNVKVKIDLPSAPGKTQTIKSTVGGTNTNTVIDTATVNLSIAQANLEYIPGSAQWRHNAGTNANPNYVTQSISDAVVTGNGVVVEDAKPCFNFEATVTILVRVKAPVVSIVKEVRHEGETAWTQSNTAKAGETLDYQIRFKNEGNTTLKDVVIGDNLPPHMTYVNGSTKLRNGANPNGISISSNNVASGGIDVGNYAPGSVGYVLFKVKINEKLSCGTHKFENVGIVRPEGMNEYFNVAVTNVTVPCGGGEIPKTVTEIPQTGAATAAGGLFGASALGYVTRSWLRSKKALLEALKR